MSAVAGNVCRIAAIQTVSNITISSGARFGVDKTVGDPVNYLDKDGNPVPIPAIDGKLVDGAVVTRNQPTRNGITVNFPGSNVFVI